MSDKNQSITEKTNLTVNPDNKGTMEERPAAKANNYVYRAGAGQRDGNSSQTQMRRQMFGLRV